jgi:kynureninase
MPQTAPDVMSGLLCNEWGQELIGGWNTSDWIGLPQRLGARIAKVIGASGREVLACDSISINLFKLLVTALELNAPRKKVVIERGQFPTDGYVAHGLSNLLGEDRIRIVSVDRDDLVTAIDDETAVVLLSHVHYVTSEKYDLAEWTERAHAAGALVIWDIAHSAGIEPLHVSDAKVDFATGCTYKFLCGGPGGPSFVYVAERWLSQAKQPIWGWMGHRAPFEFSEAYEGANGIGQFLTGTPSIIAMAAAFEALSLFQDLDFEAVRMKSQSLSQRLIDGVAAKKLPVLLASPEEATMRGSHVSFRHPKAYSVMQALIEAGVVGDFRAPDVLRFGIHPLVNSYLDIDRCLETLHDVLADQRFKDPRFSIKQRVT